MIIRELDRVVLTGDIPHLGLETGDVGTVVLVHANGEGFEVEFLTLTGETVAVTTLRAEQVRPAGPNEITHARAIA